MSNLPTSLPKTSLSLLQQDAPSLVPLHTSHPDIFILCPSSPDYDKYHFEYDTHMKTKPLAKIFPANKQQLEAAFNYCSSQSPPIPVTVRGGGHDYHGRNILSGAVQLDLSLLKSSHISPPTPSNSAFISIGPGTLSIDAQREAAKHGFAIPTAWTGSVGVIGWACGGGYGLEAGSWGLGVDNILGAGILTPAEGFVDTDDDPELLWAIRGAGLGNFGVVSEIRLKVYPSPLYLAGFLIFPLGEGEGILSQFEGTGVPREFSGEMTIGVGPNGKPIINFLFAWMSEAGESLNEGWKYLERLKGFGTVLMDTVAETTWIKHHEAFNENPNFNPKGYMTIYTLAVSKLEPKIIKTLMENPPPATSAVLIHHAHGQAIQPDANAAWAHRDRHYVLIFVGKAVPDATEEQQREARDWAREIYEKCFGTGLGLPKSYWSVARPEHCEAAGFFGQDTVDRLRKLKQMYNPKNALPAAYPVLS